MRLKRPALSLAFALLPICVLQYGCCHYYRPMILRRLLKEVALNCEGFAGYYTVNMLVDKDPGDSRVFIGIPAAFGFWISYDLATGRTSLLSPVSQINGISGTAVGSASGIHVALSGNNQTAAGMSGTQVSFAFDLLETGTSASVGNAALSILAPV